MFPLEFSSPATLTALFLHFTVQSRGSTEFHTYLARLLLQLMGVLP